jgi:small-conductance mechanosensitive channel
VVSLTRHLHRPLTFFIPLLFVSFSLPFAPFTLGQLEFFRHLIEILNIAAFGWILIKLTSVARDMVLLKYNITRSDNIRERKLLTQLQFLKRLTIILIVFVTICLILLSFDTVRTLGTGLLTSAGVAGVVVGFAAQRSLANLLAGLQLAFTQPIRIDDVLVIENEFGRVEEITLTYVVLHLWDQRRLVIPLNYFIENPIPNWTRTSAEIIGTVYFYTDYTLPVEEVRKELNRILTSTKLWNGKVGSLSVTDSLEKTIQLRAVISADNSGLSWDLRVLVREKLIEFIQKNYPDSLPRIRTELVGDSLKKFEK